MKLNVEFESDMQYLFRMKLNSYVRMEYFTFHPLSKFTRAILTSQIESNSQIINQWQFFKSNILFNLKLSIGDNQKANGISTYTV